jgi:hypothetical protein
MENRNSQPSRDRWLIVATAAVAVTVTGIAVALIAYIITVEGGWLW